MQSLEGVEREVANVGEVTDALRDGGELCGVEPRPQRAAEDGQRRGDVVAGTVEQDEAAEGRGLVATRRRSGGVGFGGTFGGEVGEPLAGFVLCRKVRGVQFKADARGGGPRPGLTIEEPWASWFPGTKKTTLKRTS